MSLPSTLFRLGNWRSSLVQQALQQALTSQKTSDWISYLDICLALRGLTLPEWKTVAYSDAALTQRSPKLLLRLLYTLLTPGLVKGLTESKRYLFYNDLRTKIAIKRSSLIKDVLQTGYLGTCFDHYPSLLAITTIPPLSQCSPPWVLSVRRTEAQALKQLYQPFDQLLKRQLAVDRENFSANTVSKVAVVGNSPSILDDHRGVEIDSADVVIRFNHVMLNADKLQHTGCITDLWVMSPETPVQHCPADAHSIIVSGVNSLTRPSFFWRTLPRLHRTVSECPTGIWHELVQRFNAPPSAGVLILATLLALKESLNINIRCYGFTKHSAHHAQQKTITQTIVNAQKDTTGLLKHSG